MKKIINYFKKNPFATAIFITLHAPLFIWLHGMFWGTIAFYIFVQVLCYKLLIFRAKPINVIVKNYIKNNKKDSLR